MTLSTLRSGLKLLGLAAPLVACMSKPDRPGRTVDGDCTDVEEISKSVIIRSNADLDKLPKGCWDLFGKLSIQGQDITSLAKLGKLQGVNELQITSTNLATIDTPDVLKVYGPVDISNNGKLTSLDRMDVERADNLTMAVKIDNNAVLANLGGVTEVTRIDGDLEISSNPLLANANFNPLTRVDGTVRVTDNAALKTLDVSHVAQIGGLQVINNGALASVSGMAATEISGDVLVRSNKTLTSLGQMSTLNRISGNLTIDDNDALATINTFTSSMQFVVGQVSITNNAALTGLGQVAHLRNIGSLTITDNPALSFCAAREVALCTTVAGSITVQNNKVGNNCTSWCGQ